MSTIEKFLETQLFENNQIESIQDRLTNVEQELSLLISKLEEQQEEN